MMIPDEQSQFHDPKPGDVAARSYAPTPSSPVVALSIRQPWAWLILHGGKDIENRQWKTRFRGLIYVHAGKGMTRAEYNNAEFDAEENGIKLPPYEELERGGIVGQVEIVDCVTQSASPWFFGDYGFVLRNAKPLTFRPCKGALGFFNPGNEKAQP